MESSTLCMEPVAWFLHNGQTHIPKLKAQKAFILEV